MSGVFPHDPRRIAVWTGNDGLRSMLLLCPFLERLKLARPFSRIDLLAPPEAIRFFQAARIVDQVHEMRPVEGFRARLAEIFRRASWLRRQKYDAIIYHDAGAAMLLSGRLAGIPFRAAQAPPPAGILLSRRVPRLADQLGRPGETLSLLAAFADPEMLEEALDAVEDEGFRIAPFENDGLTGLLRERRVPVRNPLLVIVPGNARMQNREYPYWFPEAILLIRRQLGSPTIVLAGPEEARTAAERFVAETGVGKGADLVGLLPHDVLAALFCRAALVVSVDPDCLLLADLLGVPCIGFARADSLGRQGLVNRPAGLLAADRWDGRELYGIDELHFVKAALDACGVAARARGKAVPIKVEKKSAAATPGKAARPARPAKPGKPAAARKKRGG